ncbi:hypothetical protein BDA96_03G213900 [Sorghum bicolor]|uniref:Uncharacterized protein n=1 Tax=Sorghum bicolor TaxID=4558 RepID=A0A921RF75_SORBI|nr:hypothetical protein BDA96_03G213900 [Sorghum bicolor]
MSCWASALRRFPVARRPRRGQRNRARRARAEGVEATAGAAPWGGYICQLVHWSKEEKLEKNWCETDKKKAKKKEKKMRLRFDSLLHGCEEKGAEEKSIRERRTPHEKQRDWHSAWVKVGGGCMTWKYDYYCLLSKKKVLVFLETGQKDLLDLWSPADI